SRSAFRILKETGDLEHGLRINPDTPLGGRPLGIRGEDVALGDKGGVKISYVAPEGAMGKAGLLPNDLIVAFRGKTLSASRPMVDLWKRAQETRSEGPAAVEIQRGGETKTMDVTWSR